ncbi:replication endonuclease [Erwinia persicina]|uniref:replication endonuclease n=1 Tax=Erwinia persicina TaxID=55211 RepID=UPI001C9A797D|nr:replication endonuclease [Erwinia persicina]QZQ52283.1 replication endonuclease [Erwinia persicina]
MQQAYAYPWNAPRDAISKPYLATTNIQRRAQMFAALLRARDLLQEQPIIIQMDVKRRLNDLEKTEGLARANAYLTKTFVERTLPRVERVNAQYKTADMHPDMFAMLAAHAPAGDRGVSAASTLWALNGRFNRLADMSRADVDMLAGDIASFISAEMAQAHTVVIDESDYKYAHLLYTVAAAITRQLKQTPPLWDKVTSKFFGPEDVASALSRMSAERWWKNRLRRIAASWREHLQIALANVSKKHTPYASTMNVIEWREQKRRTREFLKGMDLQDDDGNRISLIDKYDGSVANPAIRRCELMTRIRGFEDICNEMGFVGEFYTITAPSRYHATIKTGHRNRKWNGANPAETQRYLCNLWQKVRAKLHREDIRIFGIRVAEPHHDATPHWHMLMFMLPENVDRVRQIIRDYAYQEDSRELTTEKARKARFHAEAIDPEKGSATGYVAKYISKNIDGYALDGELDDESGKELKQTAPAVSAWAARWHIRQFQFVGGAPVTVYRELRRMADSETAHGLSVEFAAVHDAADQGEWAEYVNAQGGPFVRRDELAVRTWYQSGDELNEYGEETVRIKGVYSTAVGEDTPILTRLVQWKIVPKKATQQADASDAPLSVLSVESAFDFVFDLEGAPASSRSSVNNCTGSSGSEDPLPPDVVAEMDFDSMPRLERRRLLKRLTSERSKRAAKTFRRSDKVEAACASVIEEIRELTGETITRGLATRLIRGADTEIAGEWCRSASSGELFRAPKPVLAADLSARLNHLRQLAAAKNSAASAAVSPLTADHDN